MQRNSRERTAPRTNLPQQVNDRTAKDIELNLLNSTIANSRDNFVFISQYKIKAPQTLEIRQKRKTPFPLAFRKYWMDHFIDSNAQNSSAISVTGAPVAAESNEREMSLANHLNSKPANGLYLKRPENSGLDRQTHPFCQIISSS